MPLSTVEVTIENSQVPGVVNNVPVGPSVVQVNQGPAGLSFANPMSTAADLIVGGANGNPTRLAKGSADFALTMNSAGTAQQWTQVFSQPRGQISSQAQSAVFTLTTSYQLLSLTTTLDSSTAIDFGMPSNGRLRYTGSTPKTFNVIATTDINHTTGSSIEVSIKLAKNDAVIDATQCNATIPHNGVGKLHTMWILELDDGDYVEVFFAATSGTPTVIPRRMRMQATTLL
jgi:hypothetical protein